jgi:hypothetical protein
LGISCHGIDTCKVLSHKVYSHGFGFNALYVHIL